MTHPVHFTSGRKRENMWNFYDSKRNTVFKKSDDKMSWAEDVKNKTQNVACNLVLAGIQEEISLSCSCRSNAFFFFVCFVFFTPFLSFLLPAEHFYKNACMQFSYKPWRLWCSRLHRVQFTDVLAKLRKSVFREETSSCRPSAVFSPCTAAARRQSLHCRQ